MQGFEEGMERGGFRGPQGPPGPPMPPARISSGMEAGPLMGGAMPGPIPGQMLVLAPGELHAVLYKTKSHICSSQPAQP